MSGNAKRPLTLALIEAQQAGARGRVVFCSLAAGGLAALCLLLWPGSLLHVGLVQLALLGFLLAQPDAVAARGLAVALAAGYALALLLVALFVTAV